MAIPATTGASGYNVQIDPQTGRLKMPPVMNGVDIGKILEGYREAQKAKLEKPEAVLDKLNQKATALSTIQDQMQAFSTASNLLQGASATQNSGGVFGMTLATIAQQNGLPGSTYFSVTPKFGLTPTNFEFGVNQLASKDSVKAENTVADPAAAPGIEGTLTFTTTTSPVTITINSTDTLYDIQNSVNEQTNVTGVQAEIVPSGANYKLVFNEVNYAQPITFTTNITSGDSTLLPTSSTAQVSDLQAQVSYRGEVSSYDSNNVTINGYTFQLFQTTTAPINVATDYAYSDTYNAINSWVTAYNEAYQTVIGYTRPADEITSGTSQDEPLVKTPLLGNNQLAQQIDDFLTLTVTGPAAGVYGDVFKSLSDIGITTNLDGTLSVDGLALNDALQTNYQQVKNIFAFNATSSNVYCQIVRHPEQIDSSLTQYNTAVGAENNFTLSVARDSSGTLSATLTDAISGQTLNVSPTTVDPESGNSYTNIQDVGGVVTVQVRDPGVYYGFKFLINETIANNSSTNSTFQVSQGIGDLSIKYTNRLLNLEGQIGLDRIETEFEIAADKINDEIVAQTQTIDAIKVKNASKMRRLEQKFEKLTNILAATQSIRATLKSFDQAAHAA